MRVNNLFPVGWMRNGLAAASLCLTLAAAGPAAAQASDAGAASKPPLDPERVAIARQIYDQIGVANLQSMAKALNSSLRAAMTKGVAGQDTERQQAMADAVSDSVAYILPKAIDATVNAMAQDFDTAQLRDILAFYKSPTGKVVISKMPQIMQQTTTTTLAEMPEMVRQMQLRYCAKVTCTAAESQAFAAMSAKMTAHAPG
jgi:hypothetical protein